MGCRFRLRRGGLDLAQQEQISRHYSQLGRGSQGKQVENEAVGMSMHITQNLEQRLPPHPRLWQEQFGSGQPSLRTKCEPAAKVGVGRG